MNFFIADNNESVVSMLTDIIEDYDIGKVINTSRSLEYITYEALLIKKIDILIMDLLTPAQSGLETIKSLKNSFKGKIIVISQISDKEVIGKAYSLGIEYYIIKPINKLEFINIIEKVSNNIRLQKSINDIKNILSLMDADKKVKKTESFSEEDNIMLSGEFILTELGILGENGSKDLLDILICIHNELNPTLNDFPPLKNIFLKLAEKKLSKSAPQVEIKKEIKASEQRVRRAIAQSMTHLASLGLIDYSNQKFEEYSSKFFDFSEIRKKMLELEDAVIPTKSHVRVNMRKFIKVLYMESLKKYN
ncbi:transcriptional regulator [Clostridium acetobutylicum]|nr:transcriptional regulator [Clostridium acetobutylicum]